MVKTRPAQLRPRCAPDLLTGLAMGVAIALSLSTLMLVSQTEKISGLPMPLGVAFTAHLCGNGTLRRTRLAAGRALRHVGYVAYPGTDGVVSADQAGLGDITRRVTQLATLSPAALDLQDDCSPYRRDVPHPPLQSR